MWWTAFNDTSFLLRQSWLSTFLYRLSAHTHRVNGSFFRFVHIKSCISMYICAVDSNHIFCMINEHCSANTISMATHGLAMVWAYAPLYMCLCGVCSESHDKNACSVCTHLWKFAMSRFIFLSITTRRIIPEFETSGLCLEIVFFSSSFFCMPHVYPSINADLPFLRSTMEMEWYLNSSPFEMAHQPFQVSLQLRARVCVRFVSPPL